MAQARKLALANLNASRAGVKRTDQHQKDVASKDHRIYDTVDDAVYKKLVGDRLLRDDFVEDDGAAGYADNGEEDWDNPDHDQDYDHSEDERPVRRAPKMPSRSSTSKSRPKPKKPPVENKLPTADAYRKPIAAEHEDDFMNSLLQGLDAAPLVAPTKHAPVTRKRKPSMSSDSETPLETNSYLDRHRPAPPSSDPIEPYSSPSKPVKKLKLGTHSSDAGDSSDGMEIVVEDDVYDQAFDEVDFNNLQFEDDAKPFAEEVDIKPIIPAPPIDHKAEPEAPTEARQVKTLDLETPSWLAIADRLNANATEKSADFDTLGPLTASTTTTLSSANISALEEDGTLRFFWLDYLELEGKLYLIGKVVDKSASKAGRVWASCCVIVNGIQRNLFVKPREFKLGFDGLPTDQEPSESDVYSEFDQWRRKSNIKSWMGKFVGRKYVFDDCEPGIDPELQYLKAVYGFNEPQIPNDAESPSIERILGTSTSAFELFVLKRQIMGPCWLEIQNPVVSSKGISWCKLEIDISDPKHISPFKETDQNAPRDMPPLSVASIALRTIVNHSSNQREIVSASVRFWDDMNPDDPTPPEELPSSVHTVVRCLDKFPVGFEEKARSEKSIIHTMKSEKSMLSSLLAVIKKRDPDVIVGHEFLGMSLDILLHRIKQLKVEPWSCVGRFRRTKWPNIGKQGTNIRFVQGRLICDLASDAAKSMITSTTWSLSEMCLGQLGFTRVDIDPEDTAMYFDSTVSSPDRLLSFVRHCELDTYLQMALCAKIQMLPLTKQLTGLAGNSWNKTLNGGRAERNEYILLHEFHRLKYICPDKVWGKKAATAAARAEVEAGDAENGPAAAPIPKTKRDKYKGGLVFEPKRGLWDKYILVMDFNSLYPSIIQEYNIDFTTVIKEEIMENGEEKIPDPPSPDVPLGVLPRLIATLVNRRRQVKNLMKEPKATPAQLMQWDIKQKALKLTANSMYGCLGFEHSRFYARPLAALTTSKGREILTQTKELAEGLQLDVVYGDTDSVFVNSNADNFLDALKTANAFKKLVNDRYKLLEIDLDAVFQRLLLLQKKKYAAVKMEGADKTSIEIKGLDMKRREYCALSKSVSKQVLDYVLSGQPTEIVVEEIHEYLRSVGEDLRAGKSSLEDVTIFKRLGKNPEDYDAKNQPHVQVALRMKVRDGNAKAGDVIPYIFCLGSDGQSSRTAQADKARHPDEVRKGGEDVKIDFEFYLSQQILPPIERLCEPIEGTDRARIAECLGMDPTKFQTSVVAPLESDFGALSLLMSDKERFRDVDPLVVTCPGCKGTFEFGPNNTSVFLTPQGVACPSCATSLSLIGLKAQVHTQIRGFIGQYYEGWTICTEETCQTRSRSIGIYNRACLQDNCPGTVSYTYTSVQLYNQLLYFESLFQAVDGIATSNESKEMLNLVEQYLGQSGQRWVALDPLFAF